MKLLSIVLLASLLCACHSSTTTELNRPALDTAGTRALVLKTFTNRSFETQALASYSDENSKGFGPGVFITCNSTPIVDTRSKQFANDTTVFISFTDTSYDWVYKGPDTTFEFSEPSLGQVFIVNPRQDTDIIFNSFGGSDSLRIIYQPMGSCSNLKLFFTSQQSSIVFDTLSPTIVFDTATGIIQPVPVDSLSSLLINGSSENGGTVAVAIVRHTFFSMPSIHSVVIQDSAFSEPDPIIWEE